MIIKAGIVRFVAQVLNGGEDALEHHQLAVAQELLLQVLEQAIDLGLRLLLSPGRIECATLHNQTRGGEAFHTEHLLDPFLQGSNRCIHLLPVCLPQGAVVAGQYEHAGGRLLDLGALKYFGEEVVVNGGQAPGSDGQDVHEDVWVLLQELVNGVGEAGLRQPRGVNKDEVTPTDGREHPWDLEGYQGVVLHLPTAVVFLYKKRQLLVGVELLMVPLVLELEAAAFGRHHPPEGIRLSQESTR
mmetsp:Transcript_76322/g.134732  ORF Transcript_76322/g.134732 Transcript_76322/m.134732 type:complete len:243 (+) Transcript_76322:2164-2892(+)